MALARTLNGRVWDGWSGDLANDASEAHAAAAHSVAIDDRDPYCHYAYCWTSLVMRMHPQALAEAQRSIDLTPNFALGFLALGLVRVYIGNFSEALGALLRCLRLNPNDPQAGTFLRFRRAGSSARANAAEWKADPEAAMTRLFEGLPCAPSLAQAQRVTPFMGMMEYPNLHRGVSKPGLALVGDAALSIDPLWGIGCGWALQSAEWLAGSVGRAWMSPTDLDRGLSAYAKRHRSELADHRFLIENFSTGRPFNVIERLTFSAAARDPVCADAFAAFGSRFIGVGRFLRPDALARALWVNARHALSAAKI